jgi:hypothetical protein
VATKSCSSLSIFPVRHTLLIRGHEESINENRDL